jgi:hypothetical protein
MRFEPVTPAHGEPLLAFEVGSRPFFESLMEPREPDTYSPAGILAFTFTWLCRGEFRC